WISCDAGWYGLLAELNTQLTAPDPGYEIHQIKEKYATLRFYADPSGLSEPTPPGLPPPADEEPATAHDRYEQAVREWQAGPGAAAVADIHARRALFDQAISLSEHRSAVTCERCGEPGGPLMTHSRYPWHKTLCAACADADERDWLTREQHDTWTDSMAAEWAQEAREATVERYAPRSCALIGDDPAVRLAWPAEQITTVKAARAAAGRDGLDEVFLVPAAPRRRRTARRSGSATPPTPPNCAPAPPRTSRPPAPASASSWTRRWTPRACIPSTL
ncbi:MAG: hypothetical protein M3417_13035, partial [Actinomycetota bacterium]|nr:hypothetical protein [Actinomycetota bacterium]